MSGAMRPTSSCFSAAVQTDTPSSAAGILRPTRIPRVSRGVRIVTRPVAPRAAHINICLDRRNPATSPAPTGVFPSFPRSPSRSLRAYRDPPVDTALLENNSGARPPLCPPFPMNTACALHVPHDPLVWPMAGRGYLPPSHRDVFRRSPGAVPSTCSVSGHRRKPVRVMRRLTTDPAGLPRLFL